MGIHSYPHLYERYFRPLRDRPLTLLEIGVGGLGLDDPAAVVDATGPLDIVIDDGSHRSEDVLASFRTLFPHVRDGGWYVVEDLQTAYWPRFGGTSDDLNDPATSTGFSKGLVDGLNHAEVLGEAGRPAGEFDLSVRGIHFHHNIVFVEKGRNTEPGGPDWVEYGRR